MKHSRGVWHAVGMVVECESDDNDPCTCNPDALGQRNTAAHISRAKANAQRIAECVNACARFEHPSYSIDMIFANIEDVAGLLRHIVSDPSYVPPIKYHKMLMEAIAVLENPESAP